VRRQQQYPSSGSPPRSVGLQPPSRVLIPAPANDNARPGAARAAIVTMAIAALLAAGWLVIRLF
jgi:hypothetical protein